MILTKEEKMKKEYAKMTKAQLLFIIGNTKNPKLKIRLIRILALKSMGIIDRNGNLTLPPKK